jgi:hypothetical protein
MFIPNVKQLAQVTPVITIQMPVVINTEPAIVSVVVKK